MSVDHEWGAEAAEEEGLGQMLAPLRDPAGVFRRQRSWILSAFILFGALAAVITLFVPLQYEARATIRLTAKSIPDEYVPTTIIANILEQFESIRSEVFSRERLAQVITDTGLYEGERKTTLMSALSARLREEVSVLPLENLRRRRGVPNSVTFEILMAGSDPPMLANVVNAIVAELVDTNIAYRSRQARVTTDFMRREFESADAELRRHQRDLGEFRSANRGALPEEQESGLARLERLEEQRRTVILQLSDLRARLEQLDTLPVEPGTRESIENLRLQLETAKTLYTDDHPSVRSLTRRLEILTQEQADADVRSIDVHFIERSEIEADIERQEMRLAQIDAGVEQIESRFSVAPQVAEEYAALLRREQILQENYLEYLRKLKDAELALSLESAQQGAQLTRLDAALPPSQPKVPRWMIAAGGGAISLLLALAIGILRDLFNPVVVDRDHLEGLVPLPCLGAVPRLE